MPIYDITHYLPIQTPPPPETDEAYYTKPILVLIVSHRINTWNKYLSLIRKLQREARLLCVTNVYDLNELVDQHADEIAGFIATTGDIMLADDSSSNSNSAAETESETGGMIEGLPTRLSTLLKHHAYSLRMNRWTLWHRRPWIETPDTVVGEWDENQSEGEVAGDEEGSEEIEEDDGGADEDGDGEDNDEKLRADCAVAIHEVKLANETETETEDGGRSYVPFIGHLEDSRSMASLILGICGVEMDDSE
ncbi:uncharacterized protein AFUA_4G08634 [Aspergillus fumigatus Af293]|uniref:Uncharacterized protein n=2 Tax=Aspergillus fumigatus TaxID=746128 RepID=A4D9N0_ASPFU|nr:hypothetical protein AFUA_4G08634 [Aspergillus fumigatus Af293]EBA27391.1 hypothetical protein AFUA_4G08634 [Aspergillus fumigatus Af293]EDP50241.1 conserved hypothetical protein [Aspergillus fumigatus A1163]